MNDRKFNEKLLEFFMEIAKPKKFEAGYVEAKLIVRDGLAILGLDATDILGFVKAPNERAIRRVRGAQAWFKKMYEGGWKYAGNFEYEGLLNNGFVIMERELPNKTLDAIRDEIEVILKEDESKYIHVPKAIPPEFRGMIAKTGSLRESPDDLHPYPTVEELNKGIEKVREPKEGFESDVNNFMLEATKEMKTLEEIFFDETGKNAVWHGKETKTFKQWKVGIKDAN